MHKNQRRRRSAVGVGRRKERLDECFPLLRDMKDTTSMVAKNRELIRRVTSFGRQEA